MASRSAAETASTPGMAASFPTFSAGIQNWTGTPISSAPSISVWAPSGTTTISAPSRSAASSRLVAVPRRRSVANSAKAATTRAQRATTQLRSPLPAMFLQASRSRLMRQPGCRELRLPRNDKQGDAGRERFREGAGGGGWKSVAVVSIFLDAIGENRPMARPTQEI